MTSNEKTFAQDKKFWNNYLKGRPQAPDSLFERIFSYHQNHGGDFNTVHDVGAGNGPYGMKLRSRFNNVIVSDIVAKNIELAEERLGHDGFRYRAAKVEDAEDIAAGTVDMVFATNVMHFPNQEEAMTAIAKQLRSGGTFACGTFGPARFEDSTLQDLWQRITYQGGREMLKGTAQPEKILSLSVMARTQEANVGPTDTQLFLPGAKRVFLNWESGGIVKLVPPEEANKVVEINYTGPNDEESFENEEGWSFEADLVGVKAHMNSFPFIAGHPDAFKDLFSELETLLGDGRTVRGYWPAKVILATRR
jgi:SAM-dependent methyltransferase